MICPSAGLAQNVTSPLKTKPVIKDRIQKPASKELKKATAELTITPAELNFGIISFEKPGEGRFNLKNTGSGSINWSTQGPEGWKKLEKRNLSGLLKSGTDSLKVEIRLLIREDMLFENRQDNLFVDTEMKIESKNDSIVCLKKLTAGHHTEEIIIDSKSGPQKVLTTFVIAYTQKNPLIKLNPLRLDMGGILPERTVSKKILLTNSGKDILSWSVAVRKHETGYTPDDLQRGRYLSFVNEDVKGSGVYVIPGHINGMIELTGQWFERNGYPAIAQGENILEINFNGTGIILYFLSCRQKGNLTLSLDKQLIDKKDFFEDVEANAGEILIADKLSNGPHMLTITSKDSPLVLEGMKILGPETFFFPEKSIKIFPDSGATTRQTNYLTVSLNTKQMFPGLYKDDILFITNGGEAIVEVFAEVLPDIVPKVIDIYRYFNGSDYLFTADPQSEIKRLFQNRYVKEGIAFRLFQPDTPGTVRFYRWYNPQRKSHFYHYDHSGGKKDLRGYILEGTMGNIATSKLTNTRELYRWYNAQTGHYFYSTDLQGGKLDKKAFRFDGIAGYVK